MTSEEPRRSATRQTREVGVMPDEPDTKRLFLIVTGLVVGLAVVVLMLVQLFGLLSQKRLHEVDLSVDNELLLELRERDRERLEGYGVVDAERGLYRVPIAEAMEELALHPELVRPLASPPRAGESSGGAAGEGAAEDEPAPAPAPAEESDG